MTILGYTFATCKNNMLTKKLYCYYNILVSKVEIVLKIKFNLPF